MPCQSRDCKEAFEKPKRQQGFLPEKDYAMCLVMCLSAYCLRDQAAAESAKIHRHTHGIGWKAHQDHTGAVHANIRLHEAGNIVHVSTTAHRP